MVNNRRDGFLGNVVGLATRRPGRILGIFALLVVLGLGLATRLEIQTSRFSLVSAENPYQRRLLSFFERFGQPDAPVFVVRGGDPASRRAVVDRLVDDLERSEDYRDRTLGRVGPQEVAELLLIQRPELLEGLRKSLPPGVDLAGHLERGLPGLLQLLEVQLTAGLDGDVDVDPSRAEAGFDKIAGLATALATILEGGGLEDSLSEILGASEAGIPAGQGLDDQGYLVGRRGEHHLVATFPKMGGTEVSDYRSVVDDLRIRKERILAAAREDGIDDVSVLITGMPSLTVDEQDVLSSGLIKSSLATSLGIFVLLLLAFRSFWQTLIALIPVGLGSAISMGALFVLFGHLNTVTSGFLAVLMGMGIDFTVHLLARSDESIREGRSPLVALEDGHLLAGRGVITGAVTSAVAFLTLSMGEFTAFGEMAVISSVGLLITVCAALFVLPVLQAYRLGVIGPRRLRPRSFVPAPALPGMGALPRVMRLVPKSVLIIGATAALFGAICFPGIEFNSRYFDFLPEENESAQALEILENDGALSPLFAFVQARDIEDARTKTSALRGLGTVGVVQSPSDLLPPLDATEGKHERSRRGRISAAFAGLARDPDFEKIRGHRSSVRDLRDALSGVIDVLDEVIFELDRAQRGGAQVHAVAARAALRKLGETLTKVTPEMELRLATLEQGAMQLLIRSWTTARAVLTRGRYSSDDLPELFRSRNAAVDGSGAVAIFVYPEEKIWEDDMARRFSEDVESVDPQAAGHAISMHHHNAMVISDFTRAAALALVLVLGILIFDFRRVGAAVLAMTPVVLGWLWMIGLMAVFGLRFNVANIVVLPLLLGIGIDAGVHMIHRCRQSAEFHGGIARLEDLVQGTGSAVVLSSATTMVGFGGLMASDYGGMVSLGGLMVLGIGCCIVASILVLPALLIVLGRVR